MLLGHLERSGPKDFFNYSLINGLLLQQLLGKRFDEFFFRDNNLSGSLSASSHDLNNLSIYFILYLFAILFSILSLMVVEPSYFFTKTILGHQSFSYLISLVEVITGSCRYFVEENLLGYPTSQYHTYFIQKFDLREYLMLIRKILSKSKRSF